MMCDYDLKVAEKEYYVKNKAKKIEEIIKLLNE